MDYDGIAVEESGAAPPARMDMRHKVFYGCVGVFLVSKTVLLLWLFFFFNVLKGRFGW
jgi:hypothetical protein